MIALPNKLLCSILLAYPAVAVCMHDMLPADQTTQKIISSKTIPMQKQHFTRTLKKSALQPHPTPSIWSLLAQNKTPSAQDKKHLFIHDCTKATTHVRIPKHTMQNAAVRLATYNVHFWTDPFEKKNYQKIIATIQQLQADILVLQEMHLFDNVKISSDLVALGYKHHAFFPAISFNMPYGKAPFGTLISSKYPFAQPPTRQLFTIDQQKGDYRGFVNTRIQLPQGIVVSVYGLHADGYDTTEIQRIAEINELLKIIKQDPSINICIMADLNGIRKQDYNYTIQGKHVWNLLVHDDCLRVPELCPTKYPTTTFDVLHRAGFMDCFSKMAITSPKFTSWPGKVVDFIMLNKTWNLPVTGCYVVYDAASDHCPIIMDVNLVRTTQSATTNV